MDFWLSIGTWIAIYGLLALGLNIQFGYTGLLNFGYVAFFSWGAFTSALLSLPPGDNNGVATIGFGLPPYPVTLIGAGIGAAFLAVMIGLICGRLSEHYLAIATFAFAEILHTILTNEIWLSGGPFGITTVPQPGKGSLIPIELYPVFLAIMTIGICSAVLFALQRGTRRGFGRVLRAVRDDPIAAQAFGKNIVIVRLKALGLGAGIAGLAGGLWTHSLGVVHVGQFIPIITFQIWLALLLGGRGNHWGVLGGTVLVVLWREGTRFLDILPFLTQFPEVLPSLRHIFIGLMVIIVIRLMPDGLIPEALGSAPEKPSLNLKPLPLLHLKTPALTVSKVNKSYQGLPVLQDLSFSLPSGTATALSGDNGAGKSTLIDIISGFTVADSGRITVFGNDLTQTPPYHKNRAGLVRTFQTPRLFESMSVWDNLLLAGGDVKNERFLNCLLGRSDETALNVRGWEMLEMFALPPNRRAATLSGGERKLLTLAMALMTRSPLILLDEPTAGLHPDRADSVSSYLQTLRAMNHTFLIVEHNQDVMKNLCQQVLVLDQGRLLYA